MVCLQIIGIAGTRHEDMGVLGIVQKFWICYPFDWLQITSSKSSLVQFKMSQFDILLKSKMIKTFLHEPIRNLM